MRKFMCMVLILSVLMLTANIALPIKFYAGNESSELELYSTDNIINVTSIDELQSEHPYSSNTDITYVYEHQSDADSLNITFSDDTEVESNYDFIYIYDENDVEIDKYTGAELAGQTVEVSGNVAKIRLTSDSSVNRNGFTVTSIDAVLSTGPITNLRYTSRTKDSVTLSFPAPKEATSVTVEQSVDGKEWITSTTTEALGTSSAIANVIGLEMETQYYFRLNVVGGTREGLSNEINVTTYGLYTPEEYFEFDNGVITKYVGEDVNVVVPPQINDVEVTAIGDYAFDFCHDLTNITIPDSVTSIGLCAFDGCDKLTNITIPSSVVYIGDLAFHNCFGLTSIDVETGNKNYCSIDGNLFNYDKTSLIRYPIRKSATTYIIPDGVTSIDEYAFYNCGYLANITIPNGVTSIDEGAFSACYDLTSITIPDGVTSISYWAFDTCSSLTSVTIPKTVTSIKPYAFENCDNLIDVYYRGSEEEWNNISIDSDNECLTNATIHYNYKTETDEEDDEPLPNVTRVISAEFIGGQDIVYNADNNSYNVNSFNLIGTLENLYQLDDWDREDYSAHNIKVELTLPEGFSFEQNSNVQSKTYLFEEIIYTDNITDTIYLSNPLVGTSQMNVKISGDNIEETNTTYEFNIDKYEFEIDIYRAKHLTNSKTGSIMEDTYINIGRTPCKILYDAGQENGLDNAVAAWDSVMNSLDIVDNPASIADYAFEEKDMYEAIIMSLFESSVDYKIMGYINGEITKQSKNLFSQITSQMKNKYNFDLLDGTNLKKLTDKQRQEVADDMAEYFKNDCQNAAIVSKGVGFVSDALKYANDFQSLCEKVSAYYNIMCLSDSMKQVMQDMYNECPANNLALKQALKDCINIMNSGDDEFTQKMLVNLMGLTGKNVAQAGINEYWNSVKTTFSVAHPAAFAFQAAYSAGKYITQVCFNADAIAEKYCNIVALMNVETLLDSIYNKTKTNFQLGSTQSNAKLYNSIVDVMFNMKDTDCKYAIAYLDAIDSSLASKLSAAFGDSSVEEAKKSVKSIQSSSSLFYVQVLTDWITQLYEDDINKYYDYEHLIDESYENYRKKYNINCPVDVYVFDKNGVIVGSVVNNVPYCRDDANITISVIGDRKTIYMYGEEYDIVYKGNDTGTMDITVTEYDETNAATRNVYFNNLELTEGLTYTSSETGTNSTENVYTLSNESNESIAPDFDSVTDVESETYTATISRGYFADTMAISQELHSGENVDITAYVPEGYKFVNWTSDAECDIFDNSNSITTKITMPDYDVNITAILVSVPTLSISAITENSVEVKAKGCETISSGKVILAIYNEDGSFRQSKIEDFAEETTFNGLNLTTGKVKVILWENLNTLIPLTNATEKLFCFTAPQ